MALETKVEKAALANTMMDSAAPKRPLNLLSLPLDALKSILKEVTQTNDLTALALTNSTLNELVTPIIYSRFDIVWPYGTNQNESRTGVDALTFGLATLVMRQELFDSQPVPNELARSDPSEVVSGVTGPCHRRNKHSHQPRRGNYYSHFVKKFSLGNGPAELVQDYVITRDNGKLLGTMVALAVAKMTNLETFFWDMPTGILRDIWMALSSLGDHQPSKLEKVYIRFHDNRKAYEDSGLVRSPSGSDPPATAATATSSGQTTNVTADNAVDSMVTKFYYSRHHVESPNFSILPPLKSVSALDVDEIANLDELSLLIGRSVGCLRELRVGMSQTLNSSALPAKSRALKHLLTVVSGAPANGTLSLLFSGLPQCWALEDGERQAEQFGGQTSLEVSGLSQAPSSPGAGNETSKPLLAPLSTSLKLHHSGIDDASIDPVLKPSSPIQMDEGNRVDDNEPPLEGDVCALPDKESEPHRRSSDTVEKTAATHKTSKPSNSSSPKQAAHQSLHLTTLELERHFLFIRMLRKAIDFSYLTNLTLLKCGNTSEFWTHLTTHFAPTKQAYSPICAASTDPKERSTDDTLPRLRRMPASSRTPSQTNVTYRLNLKHIHTDTVSSELLTFVRQTLAPNSLEWIFLQDCAQQKSTVTPSQIYKSILRRHKGSLTKFMLDSALGPEKSRARSVSARKWIVNREILSSFLGPGKAPKIRELSISLEYKDWHWLLQQLPNIPTLRSLHIPYIVDHVWGSNYSVRDVAMGVIDVINLRKECELAYLAIASKCFEITETRAKAGRRRRGDGAAPGGGVGGGGVDNHNDDDDSSEDDITPHVSDDDDEVSEDENVDDGVAPAAETGGDSADEVSSSSDEGGDTGSSARQTQTKMKLREILFYDDKVSIFRARHGKL